MAETRDCTPPSSSVPIWGGQDVQSEGNSALSAILVALILSLT